MLGRPGATSHMLRIESPFAEEIGDELRGSGFVGPHLGRQKDARCAHELAEEAEHAGVIEMAEEMIGVHLVRFPWYGRWWPRYPQ